MWFMATVWNSIAREHMLIRTDIFLVWVSLFSQHQEQCLALGMKEKRKGEVKRGERDRHRSLSL